MSPFSPTIGLIIYAFGIVFSLCMLIVSLFSASFSGGIISALCMLGFYWGYLDCVNWSKRWSDNENNN